MNHFDDNVLAMMTEATYYHESGKWHEALALYQRILDISPQNSLILHAMGLLQFEFEHYDLALQYIDEAIAIDPNSALFYRSYGNVLLKTKQLDEAIGSYQISLLLDPKNSDVIEQMAKAFEEKNDIVSAIKQYQEMAKYPNLAIKANFCLAECFYRTNNFVEAKKHYGEALSAMPFSLHIITRYAFLLLQEQDYRECIKIISQGITYYPKASKLHHLHGKCLFHLNDYDNALIAFERAINTDDIEASIYYDYAICLEQIGDKIRANRAMLLFKKNKKAG